jgi:hypothetical protein
MPSIHWSVSFANGDVLDVKSLRVLHEALRARNGDGCVSTMSTLHSSMIGNAWRPNSRVARLLKHDGIDHISRVGSSIT